MQFVDIFIESVSKDVAVCNSVILKCNDSFRYLFVPKLIDNAKDKTKCISGQFIVQKKSKNDSWDNYNYLPLNKLAIGQWINLDLSTSSMETFISYIEKLRDIYLEEGKYDAFGTVRTFVFSSKLDADDKELILDMFNKNSSLKNELKKLVKEELNLDDVLTAINNGKVNINDIANKLDDNEANSVYNVLQAKLINPLYLEDNFSNTDEKFWQNLFKEHLNIISSIIPSIIYFIEDQPYMGGKAIDNKGASIGDFLYKAGTDNVSIIEIKTPSTELMSNEYRNNVYCPSRELSGSIIQIRKQKDGLQKEYPTIKLSSMKKGKNFSAYDPKSYIIIGNTKDLNSEQLESFELFRNGLKDIEIITFNELIDKLKILQEYLTDTSKEFVKNDDLPF